MVCSMPACCRGLRVHTGVALELVFHPFLHTGNKKRPVVHRCPQRVKLNSAGQAELSFQLGCMPA